MTTTIDEPQEESGASEELRCQLCETPLRPEDALRVNGVPTCRACVVEVSTEVAESQAGAASVPLGFVGALVGAALGAAAWIGVSLSTDYEVGYIAVLVGWLAGKGAVLATGGAHGRPLQVAAVAASVLGLVTAKYVTFAAWMLENTGDGRFELGRLVDPELVSQFTDDIGGQFGAFDLLWVFLAVTAAWRVPATPQLEVDDA